MYSRRIFYVLIFVPLILVLACSDRSGEPVALKTPSEPSVSIEQVNDNQDDDNQGNDNTEPVGDDIVMDIYKSTTCGCCAKWIDHAEQRGFSLTVHHPKNLNRLKSEHNIASDYRACHTVVSAEGYVFEGHIPVRYIQEFLAAPPTGALGLAVPGMPTGSPGMEMGDRFDPYQVLLLKPDGSAEVFADVDTQELQYE
jgi:hypothetical protein